MTNRRAGNARREPLTWHRDGGQCPPYACFGFSCVTLFSSFTA